MFAHWFTAVVVPLAALLGRLAVGGLFVLAGWSKLRASPSRFLEVLLAYDLLPRAVTAWFAEAVPLGEVTVGCFLILGLFTPLAALAAAFLLVVFTSAVGTALVRNKDINCGCFGGHRRIQSQRWVILSRNSASLLALALVAPSGARLVALDQALPLSMGMAWWSAGLVALLGFSLLLRGVSQTDAAAPVSTRVDVH